MKEIFKRIKNYDNYLISNYGVVKKDNGKIIKLFNSNGYKRVGLYKNGKQKFYKVHRLVAEAFIPNPNNLPFVNHKNEKRDDNYFENLEWCDFKYNINYGTSQERKGKTMSLLLMNREDMSKKVCQFNENNELINTFQSIQEASRKTKIHYSLISKCCNGYMSKTHNYIWKFKSE